MVVPARQACALQPPPPARLPLLGQAVLKIVPVVEAWGRSLLDRLLSCQVGLANDVILPNLACNSGKVGETHPIAQNGFTVLIFLPATRMRHD